MEKELWKGNEAIAEAALRAGCDCYFGYPITPQSEVPEYMSAHMPKHGKVFVQAESELAAINMVYGAGGAGMRAMTSSSSPGISLQQEGITYLAGAEVPCVIVNCFMDGKDVCVRVKDTGCGMTEEIRRHIFDKFYQGDISHSTKGNGLGLSMVKRIISILEARITVESEPGKGSVFTVVIPTERE